MAQIATLNNSGSAILAGQVVRQTGYSNPQQLPTIALASAASLTTATVMGVASETILNGATGQVVISGSFSPIDTSTFVASAKVFLSDTSGAISTVPGTFETVVGYATIISVTGCISILCLPPSNSCDTGGGAGATGIQGIGSTGLQGATGIGTGGGGGGTGSSNTLNMNLLGRFIDAGPLPRTTLGPELTGGPTTYIDFRARRGTPGAGGTTTIELELNGVPTGDTLSWTGVDPAWTLKSTVIAVAVVSGDRLSFRLNSREGGGMARDIVSEVNA